MTPTQEWIAAHINDLMKTRFYGKVTLSFEAGNITTVKKEETIKPPKEKFSMDKGNYRGPPDCPRPSEPPKGQRSKT